MLYLNNVGINNGPFELILNSSKYKDLLEDIKTGNLEYMQYRFSDQEITKIISNSLKRKKIYLAKWERLYIDTSNIQRGSIKEGIRYALTNYYYTSNQIDKELFKRFNAVQNQFYEKKPKNRIPIYIDVCEAIRTYTDEICNLNRNAFYRGADKICCGEMSLY